MSDKSGSVTGSVSSLSIPVSPRRSPLPVSLAERFNVHYVGSVPLGSFDIRLLNMSGLQKPLYNVYLEYLKTGGGTQKRQREVLFTELGVRVLREEAGTTKEVFVDYGTLFFWDAVSLRSFRSHGKKLYGMFESLRHDYRSLTEKPETLFQMDKKCPTIKMPASPLVTFVNRPKPNQKELDCHALAFENVEQSVSFVTTLARRTKSFYEDYGTLTVDDVLFTPNDKVRTDFSKWKLTEEGWRLTSENSDNDKNQISKSQSEFVFEHFPVAKSSSPPSSAYSDNSQERTIPKSPLNYNDNWRKPIRGRTASETKWKSNTSSGPNQSNSDPKVRSISESQTRAVSDPDEMYEYGPSAGASPRGSLSGSRSPRFREPSPPIDYNDDPRRAFINDNHRGAPNVSPAPEAKKLPFHMRTGVKVLPTLGTLQNKGGEVRPSLNRSQSDIGYVSMRTLPDEQPGGSGYSLYPKNQSTSFESSNIHHHSKMKDKEIDSDLRNTVYLEGVDDDERSVSRTDFEQCLGYLP